MNIAFIGAGRVGAPLAQHLVEAGHTVVLTHANPESSTIARALRRSERLSSCPPQEALRSADVVFLATPFAAVESVLSPLAEALAGKVLVDCTNPVGPGLTHGLASEGSGSAVVQSLVPKAAVVKAFTIYGSENLEDPRYPAYDVRPAMLLCGDDGAAKQRVGGLITDCGFEPVDVGGLVQALHLEHLTLLWVRMVRADGHSPNLVWGALRR